MFATAFFSRKEKNTKWKTGLTGFWDKASLDTPRSVIFDQDDHARTPHTDEISAPLGAT